LLIAFATAAGLLTLWGRVSWAESWVNRCQVSVVFTAMAIGGSLGDILPGESTLDHAPNEHLELSGYDRSIAVLCDVCERLLTKREESP